jgi:hypothetical protein
LPQIVDVARAGRYFLARSVRFLAADAGVRQFIDVGTGLPAAGNTHEVAQRVAPGAVPYVSRTAAQVEGYFAGLDLVPRGVVPVGDWRPDPSPFPPVQVDSLAGVARKISRS